VKKAFFSVALVSILGGIGWLFWRESIRYTLPAKKPRELVSISAGSKISTGFPLNRPLFLHFHNMECPCSRFNISELEDLIAAYRDRVDFRVILITNGDTETKQEFENKYDLKIPVTEDADGKYSYSLGVYATPQAMIINPKDSTLYYLGNYNLGRYCVAQNTRFARMALQSLLDGKPAPLLPDVAYLAFGCELDKYKQSD
jgi:hypothetical protein